VPAERESLGDLVWRQPPRILVAVAITAVGVLVLVLVAALGGGTPDAAGPVDDPVPVEELPEEPAESPPTEPPPTMVVRPDWYRKGSSIYAQRQSAQTIPAGPGTTTTTPTVTGPTAVPR
jgi:hypothetical protein